MSTPSEPSPRPAENARQTVQDLLSELFPSAGSPADLPPDRAQNLRNIIGRVARQNRSAEMWSLTAVNGAANPFQGLLSGRNSYIDVLIAGAGSKPLAGTLQFARSNWKPDETAGSSFRDFAPPVLGAYSGLQYALLGDSGDDDEDLDDESPEPVDAELPASESAPLQLLIRSWPTDRHLRGIDVTPKSAAGVEDASETVVLTARRTRDGFELSYLPEEEATLRAPAISMALCVVTEGGDHV